MGSGGSNAPSTAGTLQSGESFLADKISRLLRRPQYRAQRRLWLILTGAAPGGTAVENRGRVKSYAAIPDYAKLGGLVQIENAPQLGATTAGRATTAADETRIEAMINRVVRPSSYPTDPSGNGGGGKANR
jgi:hypothetical protein